MSVYYRQTKKKKVVQTELESDDYERFLEIAKRSNMSIKDVVREALQSWTASAINLDEYPLFKLKPVEFKVKVRSDEIEAFLYKKGR